MGPYQTQRFLATLAPQTTVAIMLQSLSQQLHDARLVVHNQYQTLWMGALLS
jgi:hypothetical protein